MNGGTREYFIRITPYGNATLDDMQQLCTSLAIDTYVISVEQASRLHFHAYIKTKYSGERLRYQLKSRLNAQVYISGREVIDKVRTIAYTIKDGSYIHRNINVNDLLMANAISHPKVTFDDRIAEIKSTDVQYVTTKVVEAYIEFDRKPYRQHIEALVSHILLKQDPFYKVRYIRSIVEKFID